MCTTPQHTHHDDRSTKRHRSTKYPAARCIWPQRAPQNVAHKKKLEFYPKQCLLKAPLFFLLRALPTLICTQTIFNTQTQAYRKLVHSNIHTLSIHPHTLNIGINFTFTCSHAGNAVALRIYVLVDWGSTLAGRLSLSKCACAPYSM